MSIDRLGSVAAEVAMKAAVAYVHKSGVVLLEPEIMSLLDALKVACKAAVPVALDDAKAAIEANMPEVAEATFLASMRLAGIGAAKEIVGF